MLNIASDSSSKNFERNGRQLTGFQKHVQNTTYKLLLALFHSHYRTSEMHRNIGFPYDIKGLEEWDREKMERWIPQQNASLFWFASKQMGKDTACANIPTTQTFTLASFSITIRCRHHKWSARCVIAYARKVEQLPNAIWQNVAWNWTTCMIIT